MGVFCTKTAKHNINDVLNIICSVVYRQLSSKVTDNIMDKEEIQDKDPWWHAINGPNPYILSFKLDDYKWQCMHCRFVFADIAKHWHKFHSKNGPKKQPFTFFGI